MASIKVKVANDSGLEFLFKVKPTTKLEKIFTAFASRANESDHKLLQFMLDGKYLLADATLEESNIKDGDTIHVGAHQSGGGILN